MIRRRCERSGRGAGSAFARAVFLFLGLCLSGCFSTTRELSKEEDSQRAAWRIAAEKRTAPVLVLSWPEALDRIRVHNTKIRSADLDIARAAEALDQVRRSLIPTANFEAGYNKVFTQGGVGVIEPFTFAATLFFDVPGLFNYRARYEAALLTLSRARLSREVLWREQVVALYRLEEEASLLEARQDALDRGRAAGAALEQAAPRSGAAERARLADGREELETRLREWRERAGEVLGVPDARVRLTGAGVPVLPYEDPSRRPSPDTLARLPVRLAALELVALRARQMGIRLQSLPEVDVSLSSPSVYQSDPGTNGAWSPQQVAAGVNTYWTLDTQGRQSSQGRLLASETAFRREVLEQERATAAARLRTALDGLAATDERQARIRTALREAPASLRPSLVLENRRLASSRLEWELAVWFFDDAQWTPAPS